jgi:enamine deaminase RidA (YjgF/YER057c/UK114 family)
MVASNECLVWRKYPGPLADEIHIRCLPDMTGNPDIAHQTRLVYENLNSFLSRSGGSLREVINQIVCFRNLDRDFAAFDASRQDVFNRLGLRVSPAATFIGQPPLDTPADMVISAIALISSHRADIRSFSDPGFGMSCRIGEQKILFAGSILGKADGTFEQTRDLFRRAEEMLNRENMNIHDVVRTWIYLRHMERDYAEFNRGRSQFFRDRGVALLPASTGICGSPPGKDADLLLSFYAISSRTPLHRSPMTSPTLNEASSYGSDFSRGLRVAENNKIGLYVSGTASVDENGHTAHAGQLSLQGERMLWNIESLLSRHGASFKNALSAITYVKNAEDAPELARILRDRGLGGVPNAMVRAAVCRPDLLCEMELIAALPAQRG